MFVNLRKSVNRGKCFIRSKANLPPSEKCVLMETALLNEKIDKTLLDYEKHRDHIQAYKELSDVKKTINKIFDRLEKYSVNDNELEALTRVCRRVNEDPNILKIQELNSDKVKAKKSGSLDFLDSQNASKSEPSTLDSLDAIGYDATRLSKSSKISSTSSRMEEKASHIPSYNQMEVKLLKGQSDIWSLEMEDPEDEEEIEARADVPPKVEQQNAPPQVEQPIIKSNDPKKELEAQFEALMAQFKDAYYEHEVDKSYRTLATLRQFVNTPGREEFAEKLNATENVNPIQDVERAHKEMLRVMKELDDEEGYHEEPTKKDYTIKFKKLPGGKVALKMEATIDASLLSLLRLFYEADGYKMWAPFVKESKQIKKLCKAANYIKLRWDFPPPLSAREGYMIGLGIVRLEENGSFLLVAKTVHEDKQLQERFELDLPATSKKVRLEIQYCGVELVPITEGRTKARIVASFDPKIKVIPANFMSFVVRKGSRYLLDKIITCAKEIEESDWRDLTDNREFYSWLENLVTNHLKKRGMSTNK